MQEAINNNNNGRNSHPLQLILPRPDDWHVHLREGDFLPLTLACAAAKKFGRCVAMPNLKKPLTSAERITEYAAAVTSNIPKDADIRVLLTLFLTDETTADQIDSAKKINNFFAVKWYPANATTNSANGVRDIKNAYPALARMEELDIPLLVHGETAGAGEDVFDRESLFIENTLPPVRSKFPGLRITMEHISTAAAVSYIRDAGARTAATVTPQHLMFNRNDLLGDAINPHLYCKPILKREADRTALRELIADGLERVFLGSDSAPHPSAKKESACGCAGVFSAPCLLEAYAQVFDELGCLNRLENFACRNGAAFYGYPISRETVRMIKERWRVPEVVRHGNIELIPMAAGQYLDWKLDQH